jgi:hypothetical protein
MLSGGAKTNNICTFRDVFATKKTYTGTKIKNSRTYINKNDI